MAGFREHPPRRTNLRPVLLRKHAEFSSLATTSYCGKKKNVSISPAPLQNVSCDMQLQLSPLTIPTPSALGSLIVHQFRERAACPVAGDEGDFVCDRRIARIGKKEVKSTTCFVRISDKTIIGRHLWHGYDNLGFCFL